MYMCAWMYPYAILRVLGCRLYSVLESKFVCGHAWIQTWVWTHSHRRKCGSKDLHAFRRAAMFECVNTAKGPSEITPFETASLLHFFNYLAKVGHRALHGAHGRRGRSLPGAQRKGSGREGRCRCDAEDSNERAEHLLLHTNTHAKS